ncbi:MAG: Glycosyl transferase group 1 [Candidatus Gottesmanbacteria bacterium GW2011_GWA2_41_12]|uniref:Glycosyl transferase group 1 n=2 Tax=Candidatus Gottesmaniibacteriota TaxID=1752720 RepID=A0A0G0WW07_9BACT|nr:MAG: Glycosyl transferase group 1 [Candidatus Gottesmanbacteria bacterium GW2011_GWC2_39_8]KKR88590.1 MAG: Glycosyl transferase group 1 [Candidatus Gottesmanbacteria bacterium GW2011_GWA2_41_12]
MRRLAVISFWNCPLQRPGVLSTGGLEIYVLHFILFLAKLGWKVDVFTRFHPDTEKEILEIGENIRVIHFHIGTKLNIAKPDLFGYVDDFSDKIGKFIKKENIPYSVIHSHYYFSGLVGIKLKKIFSIPFIHTFHTLGMMKKIYGGEINQKRIEAEKKIVKEADKIVASTDFEKDELIKHYYAESEKVMVIPPGVDTKQFHHVNTRMARNKLSLPSDKKIILFVGRIDPIKGIASLISAIHILTEKYSDFKNNFRVLLIGGDHKQKYFWENEEVVKIRKMLMEKDLECCIKFIGAKPHNMLPLYYSAADVVVLPSLYESFGLVVLEAMASEAAVLASKVGGLKFLINDGENGHLFESQNSEEMAEKLWKLLHDKSCRKKIGENARKYAKNLSWDKQAKKIESLYESLL